MNTNLDLYTAINYICQKNEELEAISLLLTSHKLKHDKIFHDLCERTAIIQAVSKINKGICKNDGIDALCDLENG